jgi:hypothetical protein
VCWLLVLHGAGTPDEQHALSDAAIVENEQLKARTMQLEELTKSLEEQLMESSESAKFLQLHSVY